MTVNDLIPTGNVVKRKFMTTPARKQYLDMKSKYSDAILLYQVGDFYETFDEDAYIASRELQIVLTSRTYGDDKHVPLAGIPLHALENYVGKLVQRGYKVAICDQVGEVVKGHQPVERADTTASRGQALALQVGRGLDGLTHHIGLWRLRRHAPDLLALQTRADGRFVERTQRCALGDSRQTCL